MKFSEYTEIIFAYLDTNGYAKMWGEYYSSYYSDFFKHDNNLVISNLINKFPNFRKSHLNGSELYQGINVPEFILIYNSGDHSNNDFFAFLVYMGFVHGFTQSMELIKILKNDDNVKVKLFETNLGLILLKYANTSDEEAFNGHIVNNIKNKENLINLTYHYFYHKFENGKKCILFQEYHVHSVTFKDILNHEIYENEKIYSIVFQMTMTLAILLENGVKHNDCHVENILIQETVTPIKIEYNYRGKLYIIETKYIAKLIDYGLSVVNKKNVPYNQYGIMNDPNIQSDLSDIFKFITNSYISMKNSNIMNYFLEYFFEDVIDNEIKIKKYFTNPQCLKEEYRSRSRSRSKSDEDKCFINYCYISKSCCNSNYSDYINYILKLNDVNKLVKIKSVNKINEIDVLSIVIESLIMNEY